MATKHSKAAKSFQKNKEKAEWQDNTLWGVRVKRDKMAKTLDEWEELRNLASAIKKHTVTNLDVYLDQFSKNAEKNGVKVHWAADAAEFNNIVLSILKDRNVKKLVKSKSMLTEECEMNAHLEKEGIICEFADPDFIVFMLTPEVSEEDLTRLEQALVTIPRRQAIEECPPPMRIPERVLSVREAMLSPSEVLPVESCVGRIAAAATVGCPPAVPIVVSGERINEDAVACFRYYGMETCAVIREK